LLAGLPRMAILERCTVCCTRSLRPLPSFSRRVTPETDANGGIADWRPREPSCCSSVCTKAAVGEPYKIGLGSVPSLGYCIGMQYGDDEYLSCIGCPGAPPHPRLCRMNSTKMFFSRNKLWAATHALLFDKFGDLRDGSIV
jgi:hypothetical protein